MDRKYVDCRDFPGAGCSVTIGADTDEELLEAAMSHGMKAHGFQDTPEERENIRKAFRTQCVC